MQTDATSHNIVGPNIVGCCWPTMLGPFAWALRPMQTDPTTHNIVACCWGFCSQQCCVRLHGPKILTGFKLYATSANKCQHCGSMQTDAISHNFVGLNSVGCCWPTMLRPFAWAFSLADRTHMHVHNRVTKEKPEISKQFDSEGVTS